MTKTAIDIEGLSKSYQIGAPNKRSNTLRDAISNAGSSLVVKGKALIQGNMHEAVAGKTDEFWALKDVSLKINRGEAIGIIGQNGAGKSTLLKVLSRITEPTEGRVRINGRVASLLEVGTGFHNELTGRENVFLNGAILGMSRSEIRSKFEEIVDFAGVEKFIDTPVKRYSSGMRVRLAFAVAANLEPEILIIDEVLAVGDAEFQKKCLGKMQDVSGSGRTVLFVSHNIEAISDLCQRGVLLSNGRVVTVGETHEVIRKYITQRMLKSGFDMPERQSDISALKGLSLKSGDSENDGLIYLYEDLIFSIDLEVEEKLDETVLTLLFHDDSGRLVLAANNRRGSLELGGIGKKRISVDLPSCLPPGRYYLTLQFRHNNSTLLWDHENVFTFEVANMERNGRSFTVWARPLAVVNDRWELDQRSDPSK